MPLYEYLCADCGRRSEVLQKLGDPPLAACPHCGGAVKKQVSAAAFHLKGTGWYATDYAKKSGGGESAKSSATSGDSKSESSSGDSKPDSKPDSKSDSKSDTKSAAVPAASSSGEKS
jgi:putative FmdB family regulatory protein